jgi:hypothetical protein
MYDYIVKSFWRDEDLESFLNDHFDWDLFAAITIDQTGYTRIIVRKKKVLN